MLRHFSYIFTYILIVGVLTCVPGAEAQSTTASDSLPPEMQKLYECRAMVDITSKANCYDTAMDAFDAARQAGDIATVTREDIEDVQKDSFGFHIPSLPKIGAIFGGGDKKKDKSGKAKRETVVKEITSPITKIDVTALGRVIFTLENGQVWRQLDSDSNKLRAKAIKRKDPKIAHIKKASLGSYVLQVNGKGLRAKVKRVK